MDRTPRRLEPGPPSQAALLGAVLVLLALLVAAAARGIAAPAAGPPPAAEVGAAVLRAGLILVFAGEAAVVALVIFAIWPGQGRRRKRYRPGGWWWPLVSFLQSAVALVAAWLLVHFHPFTRAGGGVGLLSGLLGLSQAAIPNGARQATAGPGGYEWITIALVAAALLAAGRFLVAGPLRRRLVPPVTLLAEQVDAAIAESLAELEAATDPRAAVIAAYGRMVRSLGDAGAAHRPQETAREYLERTLEQLGLERAPIVRLTDLFEYAKFSQHQVDEAMKASAAAALREIRGELARLLTPAAAEPVPA